MNAYRVYLADGTDYVTSMNATLAEAVRYFVNKELNVGQGGQDRMVRVEYVLPCPMTETIKCPRCGQDSGTMEYAKFKAWYIPHRALTCRHHPPCNALNLFDRLNEKLEVNLQVKPPCVNSDARQEMTHESKVCPTCKGNGRAKPIGWITYLCYTCNGCGIVKEQPWPTKN